MTPLAPDAEKALEDLLEGNRRFREGRPIRESYTRDELERLAKGQAPKAAVVACSDSRVVPEVLFDQPLGSLFVSRVPGNVASDGTKWMIEIAMSAFRIPLVIVLGHTGCLAVRSIVDDEPGSEGGLLRLKVVRAVNRSRGVPSADPYRSAVEENARTALRELAEESTMLRSAVAERISSAIAMIYEMETGAVIRL